MKVEKSLCRGVLLIAAAALPEALYAQNHTRYKLIDLGTLGGPSAYNSVNGSQDRIINNAGVVSFTADTPAADPNPPFCYWPDCFVSHASRWKNGQVTDLSALPGNGNGSASGGIDAQGWIAGQSQNGMIDPVSGLPETRAALWKGDPFPIDLGTFGGNWSLATSLNNNGQVIGFATNGIPDAFAMFPLDGSQTRAFLWNDGLLQDLGTLGGFDAEAFSVNERGQVVGFSYTNATPNDTTGIPTIHPFLWDHGVMTDLGTLGGTYAGTGSCSFAVPCNAPPASYEGTMIINNRGQVIGTSNLAGDQIFHPFLWDRGTMRDLGTLGGATGVPIWLTDSGEVVGEADLPPSPPGCAGPTCIHHAFLWEHDVMTDLGTIGADTCSRALMMNSQGQIVGHSIAVCGTEATHAFLWEKGGPMVDLNTLIPADSGATLYEADSINERGEIVALGLPAGCDQRPACGHLYLLVPMY